MNRNLFVQNIKFYCNQRGIKPTPACKESGVGGSFVNDIERGRDPSVAKVQQLASFLGVTVSDLLGETGSENTKKPTPEIRDGPGEVLSEQDKALLRIFHELNEEGREKLLDTADDMVRSDKYIKIDPAGLGQEA